MSRRILVFPALMVIFSCCASPLFAQNSQGTAPNAVQVLITARAAHGSKAPPLTRQDVTVHEDKKPRPVVSLAPQNGADAPLQLVVFIDSDSTTRLGAQFGEISQFLQSLPQSATVELAYGMNGASRIDQPFTTDRAAVTKALHVTFGPAAGNTAIYAAFSDLIRKWPSGSERRIVLLVSDGIDPTYGFRNTQPDQNPDLQRAIRDAQKNRITVFSIFVSSGSETRNAFLNLNGQGSLNELTSDTGGYAFSQGTQTPISFRPFLKELRTMLDQQYLLTFTAAPAPGLHDFKVNTEVSGVKLMAPKKVFVPATQ